MWEVDALLKISNKNLSFVINTEFLKSDKYQACLNNNNDNL